MKYMYIGLDILILLNATKIFALVIFWQSL